MRAPASNLRSTPSAVQDRVNAVREKLSKVLPMEVDAAEEHTYAEVKALAVHDDEDDYESDEEDDDMEAPRRLRRRRAPPSPEKTNGTWKSVLWTLISLFIVIAAAAYAYWYFQNTVDELATQINPLALKNKESPQSRAWSWMKSSKAKNRREANIERYAMATLYYATSMYEDPQLAIWMDDGPVCDWEPQKKFKIECVDDIITTIDFSEADISGPLVPEIGLLTTLHHLTLASNQFTGSIPTTIGLLTNLRNLDLSQSFLTPSTRTIPEQLHKLTDIKSIYLDSNGLTGSVPANLLSHMSDLRVLSLADNGLAGSFPSGDFHRLTDLSHLNFQKNKFDGAIPVTYKNLPSLKTLDISYNQIQDTWAGLPPRIEVLNVAGLNIKGAIPNDIRQLSELLELDISNNALTGELTPLPPALQRLDASNNLFHGLLPLDFPPSLIALYLDHNNWEGSIPEEFAELMDLDALSLANTDLEGYIPLDFPQNVRDMDFRATKIGGPIDPSLCRDDVKIILDCDVPLGCDDLPCCEFQSDAGKKVRCSSRPEIPPPLEPEEDEDDEDEDDDFEDDDEE